MAHKYVYKFLMGFLSLVSFASSAPRIQCFDDEANNRVKTHFQQWKIQQEETGTPLISPLDYCDYLVEGAKDYKNEDIEKKECAQILTLIYTVGAYFGLVPAGNEEETDKANSHLIAIAGNAVDKPENSIAIEALHCRITDGHGEETTNPNIATLEENIEGIMNLYTSNYLKLSFIQDQADEKLINWFRFLAGCEEAKIVIRERERNIHEVLNLPDRDLEGIHDFIQVIFPNYTKGVNDLYCLSNTSLSKDRGIMPQEIFDTLWSKKDRFHCLYTLNLKRSFYRMMKFYGLRLEKLSTSQNKLVPILNTQGEKDKWSDGHITKWGSGNHNTLRLTRILIALRCARLDNLAESLFDAMEKFSSEASGSETRKHWKQAHTKTNYSRINPSNGREYFDFEIKDKDFLHPRWKIEKLLEK